MTEALEQLVTLNCGVQVDLSPKTAAVYQLIRQQKKYHAPIANSFQALDTLFEELSINLHTAELELDDYHWIHISTLTWLCHRNIINNAEFEKMRELLFTFWDDKIRCKSNIVKETMKYVDSNEDKLIGKNIPFTTADSMVQTGWFFNLECIVRGLETEAVPPDDDDSSTDTVEEHIGRAHWLYYQKLRDILHKSEISNNTMVNFDYCNTNIIAIMWGLDVLNDLLEIINSTEQQDLEELTELKQKVTPFFMEIFSLAASSKNDSVTALGVELHHRRANITALDFIDAMLTVECYNEDWAVDLL